MLFVQLNFFNRYLARDHLQIGIIIMLENVQEFIFNLIITGISSAFAKTIVAPLERTKLILQNQESSLQVLKKQRKTYTGIIDVMIRVPQEQVRKIFFLHYPFRSILIKKFCIYSVA